MRRKGAIKRPVPPRRRFVKGDKKEEEGGGREKAAMRPSISTIFPGRDSSRSVGKKTIYPAAGVAREVAGRRGAEGGGRTGS